MSTPPEPADGYPLSPRQRRLWLLDRLRPGNTVHHLSFAFRVHGRLDETALRNAVADLVARHESLRSVLVAVDGVPRQVVRGDVRVPVAVEHGPAGVAGERWLAERRDVEARRPFDLAVGPLLRVRLLLPAAPGVADLLVTVHQAVCDERSVEILCGEFRESYTAHHNRTPVRLPPPEATVGDVARWRARRLAGDGRALVDYWRAALRGAPPLLELPTDRARPPTRSLAGRRAEFSWPTTLGAAVRRFVRADDVSPYAVLLAAFVVVVHRYTGRDDVVVATPAAGRATVVGCFADVVPVRVRFTPSTSFRALTALAASATAEALRHQELPFDTLVDALAPEHDVSHDPVAQVGFALRDDQQAREITLPGAVLRRRTTHAGGAEFDFSVTLRLTDDALGGTVEYSTDLYAPETVTRFVRHLRTALRAAIAKPDTQVADVPILPAAERRALVGADDPPPGDPVDVLTRFEDWAARTPDAPALSWDGAVTTYRELDRRATALAAHLAASGVATGDLVGVALDRSVDVLVAFLAVLRHGAVHVPLDPGYPRDRLAYMIEDAGIAVVLTRSDLPTPPHADRLRLIDVDTEAATTPARPRTVPIDAPAYVIYTSGSTGRPKGTVVTRRGLGNCAEAQHDVFGVTPADAVLQFASPSFDASIFEFVLALTSGARLCLAPRNRLLPGPDLVDTITRHGVTTAVLPPTALTVLSPDSLPGVRTLIVAGEACPPETVRAWAPGRAFHNAYGPTETSIWATVARCAAETDTRPPIGAPIRRVTAHVLDQRGEPLPVGVPGELYVGGAGVAQGYLGRPSLTAQRFVPDPFTARPGARLYRTGDLVRRLPDGTVDFLGRTDRQVKIRGHRIELSEVEAHLDRVPGVGRGVVVARTDHGRHPRLVGYVQPDNASDLDPATIRRCLAATLPDYLVPGVLVVVDTLPLNANGKIDHARLPEPPAPANATAPSTERERTIAAVWAEVLGSGDVGVHDNIFDLGADSLLLARAARKLTALFARPMPVVLLLTHPTVHELATALDGQAHQP